MKKLLQILYISFLTIGIVEGATSSPGKISIVVERVVADAQTVSVIVNSANNPIVLTSSGGTAPYTFTLGVGPSHGALSGFDASSGAVLYTPTLGYFGVDSFMFTAKDSLGIASSVGTISILVKGIAPAAESRCVNTISNIPINIRICGEDLGKEPLTFALVVLPSCGTVTGFPVISTTGEVTVIYTPNNNYAGKDTFQFTVENRSLLTSEPATINICIVAIPSMNASINPSLIHMISKYAGM